MKIKETGLAGQKKTIGGTIGKVVSYFIFITWALITIIPLLWMGYSSFKSNEELTRDMWALPHDLFVNSEDIYKKVDIDGVMVAYLRKKAYGKNDPIPRIAIEHSEISFGRHVMVYFIKVEDLTPEQKKLELFGEIKVKDLPASVRAHINFTNVWFNYYSSWTKGSLGTGFLNSILYSGVSSFFILFFGLMLAFAISKLQFKRTSKYIFGIVGLGYLISTATLLIPLYLFMSDIGLSNTHLGMFVIYTAFGMPLTTMLTTQFMRGLPTSLIESAYMDGASPFRTFLSIMVPMSTPVIVTVSIMNILGIWNEFAIVLVMTNSPKTYSLSVGIYSFTSTTGTQFGWQIAALVIATIPIIIVYGLFQNQLAKGVTGGALKE